MLENDRLQAALQEKESALITLNTTILADIAKLRRVMGDLSQRPLDDIMNLLQGISWPGAHPTREWNSGNQLVISFMPTWDNHRQAREWALATLSGVATCAVDGSQIVPNKEMSLPIGLVQVGWFENPHTEDNGYIKDVSLRLLLPNDMRNEGASGNEIVTAMNWFIDWQRFNLEIAQLIAYMLANVNTSPKPICFFDGSLIISFAQQLHPERQKLYVDAIKQLLAASKQTQVPVIGYVDSSYAHDLSTMLGHMQTISLSNRINDAALLAPSMNWGDRSQIFVCARNDQIIDKFYDEVCFTYLKTTADNPPARIEFPRWVLETDVHERVLDLIRAECVVGVGYPYAIETADALAVLTAQDRERFLATVQKFAEQRGIPIRFSRKSVSKRRRRT